MILELLFATSTLSIPLLLVGDTMTRDGRRTDGGAKHPAPSLPVTTAAPPGPAVAPAAIVAHEPLASAA